MEQLVQKIKELKVNEKHDSFPDGYGGDSSWTTFFLNEVPFKKNCDGKPASDYDKLTERVVSEALGAPMNLSLRKLIFEHNPQIFHRISDMNHELKEMAMGAEDFKEKIMQKKSEVKKAIEELSAMESDYTKSRKFYYLGGDH